jgi:hypothetical protein
MILRNDSSAGNNDYNAAVVPERDDANGQMA